MGIGDIGLQRSIIRAPKLIDIYMTLAEIACKQKLNDHCGFLPQTKRIGKKAPTSLNSLSRSASNVSNLASGRGFKD